MRYLKTFKIFENQISPEALIPSFALKRYGISSKKFYSELQKAIQGKTEEEAKGIAYKLYGSCTMGLESELMMYEVKPENRYHMSVIEITGEEKDGKIKPTKLRIPQQLNDRRKPEGLWYGFGDSWIKHSISEMKDTRFAFENQKYHYEVHLKNGSNILKLVEKNQVDVFIDKYKAEKAIKYTNTSLNGEGIDWIRVAEDYQGIEIPKYTEKGMRQWYQEDKKYNWLEPWDVNSGCVWDPTAIDYLVDVSEDIISIYGE